ncbi:MAG: thioredoxin family protein [Anaerolineales bacterium]
MKRIIKPILAIFCLTLPLLACAAFSRPSASTPAAPPSDPNAYNPSSDPAQDLQKAVVVAREENKRILLEVGGDWCIWCRIMDDFYTAHPDLLKLRETHYVLVKVNYSQENDNQAFLSRYPAIPGYPHIFILTGDGSFLHSQDTSELEEGKSYNLQKFTAFLQEWAKP